MVVAEPLLFAERENGVGNAVAGARTTDMARMFLSALCLPKERQRRRLTPG